MQIVHLQGRLTLGEILHLRPTPLKVILGAGGIYFPEWVATDIDELDITKSDHWHRWFQPGSIDRLLAEHVLEHLSLEDNRVALGECYRFLKPGGAIRIAVPDGNRQDPVYAREVTPPADGHKALFTLDNLTALLESVGFVVHPLEYFDEHQDFHFYPWDAADGRIRRSIRFDTQIAFKRDNLFYTSLIVDAIKPHDQS